jgi:hypothetical protein
MFKTVMRKRVGMLLELDTGFFDAMCESSQLIQDPVRMGGN